MTTLNDLSILPALSDRQQRESDYYDQYSQINAPTEVDFEPVLCKVPRPWSPYWHTCGLVRDAFTTPGQRLLDFGCGMGVSGVTFAKLGYTVQGFDVSQGNIDVAHGLAKKYGLSERCDFSVMTAEKLDYPDNHFDVVVGMDILHHIDIPSAMKEVRRVLKPGGVAIFKEPVRALLLDRLRESALLRAVASKESSLDKHIHITEDERKLDHTDLDILRSQFSEVHTRRFSLLLRLYRVIPKRWFKLVWKLQRLDYRLMRLCPPLQRLGDVCVFKCVK